MTKGEFSVDLFILTQGFFKHMHVIVPEMITKKRSCMFDFTLWPYKPFFSELLSLWALCAKLKTPVFPPFEA